MKASHVVTTALATVLAGVAYAQGGGGERTAGSSTEQRHLIETAEGPGAIVTLSPSGVRLVQQRLNQLGYDAGNLTGSWDEATVEAARRFQQANNLEPTGTSTIPTLNCLGGTQGGFALMSGNYVGGNVGMRGELSQRFLNEMARGEGARLIASPAQVRQIQQELNRIGYDAGNLTGTWDKKTSEAAKLFQQANNLEPTGQLDVAMISAMNGNRLIFGESCMGRGGGPGTTTNQRFLQEAAAGKGEPIYFSPASVRLVQQALNAAGWNAGHLTGRWDPATQRAVAQFERANQLEPTGALTTTLLWRLGMGNWFEGGVLRNQAAAAGGGGGGRYGFAGGNVGGGNIGARGGNFGGGVGGAGASGGNIGGGGANMGGAGAGEGNVGGGANLGGAGAGGGAGAQGNR